MQCGGFFWYMQAASSASQGVVQGEHPHRIWDLIYSQSCFLESLEQCTERRVFYRLISGQLRPATRLAAAQHQLRCTAGPGLQQTPAQVHAQDSAWLVQACMPPSAHTSRQTSFWTR